MRRFAQGQRALGLLTLSFWLVGCIHAEGRVDYLIEGRVVRAASGVTDGSPVVGAHVHWTWPAALMPGAPSESSALSTTVTDGAGRYRLACPLTVPAVYALGLRRAITLRITPPEGATVSVSGPGLLPASVRLEHLFPEQTVAPNGVVLIHVLAPDVAVRLAQ